MITLKILNNKLKDLLDFLPQKLGESMNLKDGVKMLDELDFDGKAEMLLLLATLISERVEIILNRKDK